MVRFNDDVSLEVLPGGHISRTIEIAHALSSEIGEAINFKFNGVRVTIRADSDPALIYRDWSRAMSGYIDDNVGPYPKKDLTVEELANDARIEATNEKRRKREREKYEAKAKTKRNAVEVKLVDALPIELSDRNCWESWLTNNATGYGNAVMAYAERWARLMQREMNLLDKTVEEVAEACSREADIDGITGFMYGCAVTALAQCWVHGEELRRWHNLETQIGEEGERANEGKGVLNPALLTFG